MTEGIHERQKLARELAKAPTGIKGLDEITLGVCLGAANSGLW